MPKVESLNLDGNQVGDAGVAEIAIALEQCLNLIHGWAITGR
jgi:hypothetical protein